MIKGIDESVIVIVFVTQAYIDKVGSGNKSDNCRKEFNYAARRKPDFVIAVPMEPGVLDPTKRSGPVGLLLDGQL